MKAAFKTWRDIHLTQLNSPGFNKSLQDDSHFPFFLRGLLQDCPLTVIFCLPSIHSLLAFWPILQTNPQTDAYSHEALFDPSSCLQTQQIEKIQLT
jgi:hypothetical protein